MQSSIRENPTPTLQQRRSLAVHMEAQRATIHAAERERVLRDWRRPAPEDSDSPLPAMMAWAVAGLGVWALFAWVVIRAIEVVRGIA